MSLSFSKNKDDQFLTVLSLTLLAGMAVGLALCGVWKYHPGWLSGATRTAAIALCPPFLLAAILDATTDSTLALVMTIGVIIFANAFLYAGLASFVYFLFITFVRRKSHG